MNKNTWIGIIVIILVIAGVWYYQNNKAVPATGEPIKVGFIAPLSGTGASYGEEAKNAALLAVEKINSKGGINGKPLELVIQDGKCETKAALDAWQKLVNLDKLKIILGGHCTAESLAIAPLTAQEKVIALANITSAPVIDNEGEYFFRNNPASNIYAQDIGKVVVDLGYKKIIVLAETTDFSIGYVDNFKKGFIPSGGEVVVEEKFIPKTTDFRSLITKIKNQPADAILISAQGPDTMGLISKQLNEMQIDKTLIFGSAFGAKKFLEASGGYVPQSHFSIGLFANTQSFKTSAFLADYENKYNRPLAFNTYLIAAVYDMVYRLEAALNQCDSEDVGCLRGVLKSQTSWSGVAGELTFTSGSNPKAPLAKVTIKDGKEFYEPIK